MDYYETLDAAKAAGLEYADNGIEAGEFRPMESPFSGEWSGGLDGQDVLEVLGIEREWDTLEEFEQTDILDHWEDGYDSADWPCYGPFGQIAGYTYLAEEYTPDQLHAAYVERWVDEGACSPAARDMGMEDILNQRAAAEGINRDDEYSFDSDDFPKVILGE